MYEVTGPERDGSVKTKAALLVLKERDFGHKVVPDGKQQELIQLVSMLDSLFTEAQTKMREGPFLRKLEEFGQKDSAEAALSRVMGPPGSRPRLHDVWRLSLIHI